MNELMILIAALVAVESGGDAQAIGDNGAAYGVLQIHAAYAHDAAEYECENWTHEDAFDEEIAVKMFVAYMERYAHVWLLGGPATAEQIARIHNGGPNGYKRSATDKYWRKVKAELIRRGAHDIANGKVVFGFGGDQ